MIAFSDSHKCVNVEKHTFFYISAKEEVMSDRPLEYCFLCDNPTDKAGAADDSVFCDCCDTGPYCEECWGKHHDESNTRISKLEAEIALKADYITRLEAAGA